MAQFLGHVTTSIAVYAYDEIKAGARDVPEEDLKNQVGAMYDVFVAKLPAQMQVLVGLLCSHEKPEELALKVWENWLAVGTK